MGLWVREERDVELPSLIRFGYGIALHSITVLRIASSRGPHREYIPQALVHFTALQNLRWDVQGRDTQYTGQGEFAIAELFGLEPPSAMDEESDREGEEGEDGVSVASRSRPIDPFGGWMKQFVLDCASNAPLLRKLTLTGGYGYRRTFKRLSEAAFKRREKKSAAGAGDGQAVATPHFRDNANFCWWSEMEIRPGKL
ncbi:hypothetical protein DL93DRAFT_2079268, partial [Clavulina sp. PMI_390]